MYAQYKKQTINIQSIKNSTLDNCKVQFSPQVCKATLLADFIGVNTLDVKLVQEVYKRTVQDVEEDLEVGPLPTDQSSFKSQYEKNKIRLINDTNMHLMTDCSRNVTAINEQTIENTTCTDASEVNFAAQVNTPEIIAQCAIDQAGNLEASQALTALTDQKAKTTMSFSGLWDLIILLLMIPLLLFLILQDNHTQHILQFGVPCHPM